MIVPRLADLQARIHGLGELENVVAALRSVSAARVQQAHGVLDSIRQYTAILHEALGDAVRGLASPVERMEPIAQGGFVIAFGSEHGFVGAFNDRVLAHAATEVRAGGELFVLGSRASLAAAERGDRVAWTTPMASQIMAVDDVALQIAEELGRRGGAPRVILVYTRSSGGATWRIVTETLMPFDLHAFAPPNARGSAPLSNLPRGVLVEGVIDELLFAQLAHAATESFASENAARLAAMESATDNVDKKLEDLRRLEREVRQEEITTELLDIIAGSAAVAER